MKNRPLIAGNWKMHKRIPEAEELVCELKSFLTNSSSVDVILIPPYTALRTVGDLLIGSNMFLGAQNVSIQIEGAYTGEISAAMLQDVGCEFVLVGHSERRNLFGETDFIINQKIKMSQNVGLQVIFCLGETLEQRRRDKTKKIIGDQLEKGLEGISETNMMGLTIAYEPIWAIGTGINASPEQARDVHQFIRKLIISKFGEEVGNHIRILYGGSVKPENCREFLLETDIDGLLVGGASLNADSFYAIINSAS